MQWVESGRLQTIPALGRISIIEIEDELARVPTLDNAGVDANSGATPNQNDVSLSQEDATEEPSLPQHSPNPLIHAESQMVGEGTQHIESSELQTISEGGADTNETPDQNNVSLSREDSTKKIRLTRDALNRLKHTDVRTVGQLLQWVESGESQTIAETEADTNETSDQNDVPLSREDSIEKLNLTEYSFNALIALGVQTVGEVLELVKSGERRPISTLGRKFILEIEGKLAQVKILDDPETEANTDATPEQNDVPLSREVSTEEQNLTQHTDPRTVREDKQQIESTETPTISEVEANTNAIPSQNDTYLSRGDTIEKLNLSQRSLKVLKRADIRLVGELLPRVESGKIRVTRGLGRKPIAEIEEKLAQVKVYDNYAQLSREDSIGQLYLRNRSLNALTRAGIRTVGEALQLVESSRLETIHGLGRKSILEIKSKLAQVTTLNDSEVEIAADPQAEEHSTISVESQGENNMGIQPGFQSNSEETSTAPGEDEADAKLTETKPQSDSQTDAALRKTWEEIFKITERLAQVKTIQNTLFLREDPIEKMNLSKHSLNAFKHIGIRTVGDALHLIKSIRLKTIHDIGAKCILEIMEILSQGKIFYDSEARWLSLRMWKGLTVKILNDAEVEMKRRKDEIPNRVVRWQSELVGKQLSKGLLHEDAIIAERSIKEWLSETKTIENNHVYEILATILDSSLNICEEIEFFLNQIPGQYRIPVLLSKYGFEAKNLAQTGAELGISRERVRQIRNELKDKVTSLSNLQTKPNLLRIQSALLIARDLGMDITYEQWKQRLQSSGLVGNWTSQDFVETDVVEVMIAICNLLADCEIRCLQMPENLQYVIQLAAEGTPNIPAKIPHARDTLPDEVKRLINRHTRFSGGVHVTWLSQESSRKLEEMKDILQGLEYRILSKDWFVPHQISYSDVFHRCLRQMFQYCGQLGIDDICAGIRHGVSRSGFSEPEYLVSKGTAQSRSVFPVPPADVMAEILRIGGYQSEDELYYWEGTYGEKLSKGEIIIMNCLEQIGAVLHHSELVHAFIERELSLPALSATLNSSPLFDKVESGLYKLRGKEVSYQDIERAKAAGKPQSLKPEIEYDTEGNIIVSVTLSAIAVGSGTILCERFPDLSGADWECYVDGEEAGELNAVENEFRRLRKPFELLNCRPGERVKFTFNTWERTVEIEKEEGNAES